MPTKSNNQEKDEINKILEHLKMPGHTKEYLAIMASLDRMRELLREW
ncbi:hypothetical protein HY485_04295 [Candidatus Woesearchaeota archaeon]|nr:hypothetical protein [Candidatus Woesearchaeota archaeon]